MSQNTDEPFYVLHVAPGIEKIFHGPSDIAKFLACEREFWQPLLQINDLKTYNLPWEAFRIFVKQIRAHQDRHYERLSESLQNSKRDDVAQFMAPFSSDKMQERALCSLNPEDARLIAMLADDPLAALIGAHARMRVAEPTYGIITTQYITEAHAALARWAAKVQQPSSYGPAWEDWMTTVRQHEAAAETRRASLEERHGKIADAAKSIVKEIQGELSQTKTQLIEIVTATTKFRIDQQNALDELTEHYSKHLTLQSPVNYWEKRAKDQRSAAYLWTGVFVVISAIVVGAVFYHRFALQEFIGMGATINLSALPILAAALLPVIWVLKHASRQFVDCMIDSRDASQRSVQAMTYLALLDKNKDLPQDKQVELSIALNALFRPGPAQPSEDGIPLPLIELFKNRG